MDFQFNHSNFRVIQSWLLSALRSLSRDEGRIVCIHQIIHTIRLQIITGCVGKNRLKGLTGRLVELH